METSQSLRRTAPSRGFTVLEVLFSMVILAVGLVTLSSLAAQTLNGTARSQYMSLAANLASEKLEDLNRWPTTDCNVEVPAASTNGSLTSDSTASVSCGGGTSTVYYYDDVDIADSTGAISETTTGLVGGVLTYTTTSHTPDGLLNSDGSGTLPYTTSTSATTAGTNAVGFHRRWTIEKDQPVAGVRRITVLVTLANSYMKPTVSYQLSMVRP
jgi:prepilin-type N-terminal cleavage/methylation domain-containing protein